MSEPEKKLDSAEQTTPTEKDATPETKEQVQPVNPVPELAQKVEELEAKNKRYLEQLRGKDKKIEELKTLAIANFQQNPPEIAEEVETRPKPAPNYTDISNTVFTNILRMREEHGNDEHVPWSPEIKGLVEQELEELDPSGQLKLNPAAWEKSYQIVKGKQVGKVVADKISKVKSEFAAKETAKTNSYVEPAAPPVQTPKPLSVDEARKKGMSTKEMLEKFPELQAQYSDRTLASFGVKRKG